ncbi:hypothetical protein RhiJN_18084 [Ceratobasidium sp. AG-Ba]|nr:hypothetical protein RhiJN_18084 [Ceratobasidium sp. AG-Ba]
MGKTKSNCIGLTDSGELTTGFKECPPNLEPHLATIKNKDPKPDFSSTRHSTTPGIVAKSNEQSISSCIPSAIRWSNAVNSQIPISPKPLVENVTIMRQEVIPSTILSCDAPVFRSLVSTHTSPLSSSLYTGPRLLSKTALTVFMIGYSHEDIEHANRDPDQDICNLRELFGQLPGVRFGSLSGNNATLFQIRERLGWLWNKAPVGTHLFVLLTGHGYDNAMELYGEESIDELELARIIKGLPPKHLHVTVVFDICRMNRNKTAVNIGKDIALIWSCTPGQRAWAVGFKEATIPSSFLLIGLLMASSDASDNIEGTFEQCLRLRIAQLARFNGHLHHRKSCDDCCSGQGCSNAFKMSDDYEQDIDLTQAQDALSQLHSLLVRWPEFTERCENVRALIMENGPFCRSNGIPLPPARSRGANAPVVEVPTSDYVDRAGLYLIKSLAL